MVNTASWQCCKPKAANKMGPVVLDLPQIAIRNGHDIVFLTGPARSGKDTIANVFVKHGYTCLKLAGALKKALSAIFGFSPEQMEDGVLKETIDETWGITPRTAMQYIGTDVFQNHLDSLIPGIGRDIWVKGLSIEIEKILKSGGRVVISDLRFPHEFDYISSMYPTQTIVYKMHRLGTSFDAIKEMHLSESAHHSIPIDGTIVGASGTGPEAWKVL